MKNKRIVIMVASLLASMVLVLSTVPVLAAEPGGTLSAQTAPQAAKVKVLLRLLLVQDEAKVDAFLAQGMSAGKLTTEQEAKIKDFWT